MGAEPAMQESVVGNQDPRWFREALDAPCETFTLVVGDCPIAVRAWGALGDPVLVLVHGGAAHARWWDHIGPLLSHRHRVLALDLSGHGDSGRRPKYSMESWAREVLAVGASQNNPAPPIVVGHSLGGWVTITAAHLRPDVLGATVVLDSSVPDPAIGRPNHGRAHHPNRHYPTRDEALSRFRTLPEQPHLLDFVLTHIAHHSLRLDPDGWTWKFDPRVFGRTRPSLTDFTTVPGRFALVRAEHGLAADGFPRRFYDNLALHTPVVELPAAGHHLMLDQPLALVSVVRTLIAAWTVDSGDQRHAAAPPATSRPDPTDWNRP